MAFSLKIKNHRRYLFNRNSYRKRESKFHLYLDLDCKDGFNDCEFKFYFLMSSACFWQLVNKLREHPSFVRISSDSRRKVPKPASWQLLVLLKYFGSEGNSGSAFSLGSFFGISTGAVELCRNAALEALVSLEEKTYSWPDADKRILIANQIKEAYLFPNYVGLIDGTLLPMAKRPLLHGENYLSRKRYYAIVVLVVCDDLARILY
jgi:hypothetical protein